MLRALRLEKASILRVQGEGRGDDVHASPRVRGVAAGERRRESERVVSSVRARRARGGGQAHYLERLMPLMYASPAFQRLQSCTQQQMDRWMQRTDSSMRSLHASHSMGSMRPTRWPERTRLTHRPGSMRRACLLWIYVCN